MLPTLFTVSNVVSNFIGAASFSRMVYRRQIVSLVSQRTSEVSILCKFEAIENSLVWHVFLLANLRFECNF